MLPDKELVKKNLEDFFRCVDEIVKPYFDKFGYTRRRIFTTNAHEPVG